MNFLLLRTRLKPPKNMGNPPNLICLTHFFAIYFTKVYPFLDIIKKNLIYLYRVLIQLYGIVNGFPLRQNSFFSFKRIELRSTLSHPNPMAGVLLASFNTFLAKVWAFLGKV